jgi:hypothetical protein
MVFHLLDPGELELEGPAEARFEDPETRTSVVLRPREWAAMYRSTVETAVSDWRRACLSQGVSYNRVSTDTPFGLALRAALASASGPA